MAMPTLYELALERNIDPIVRETSELDRFNLDSMASRFDRGLERVSVMELPNPVFVEDHPEGPPEQRPRQPRLRLHIDGGWHCRLPGFAIQSRMHLHIPILGP